MESEAWYCIKAKPRQEGTARRSLESEVRVPVFCPMLRFERARATGKVRVTEAMFPGYLFARFSHTQQSRHVAMSRGVAKIVGFGGLPAIVPDPVIDELRNHVSETGVVEVSPCIAPGDEVRVVGGPMAGIQAIVTHVLPARSRVKILLELLGMEREVEIPADAVLPNSRHPLAR